MTIYEILWLIVLPGMALSWYYLLKGRKTYIPNFSMPHNPYPHITFLLAAREITPLLSQSVNSIIESCGKCKFTDYDIKVVADKDGTLDNTEHIIVPEDYTCNSKFKARALNYALKYIPDSPDVWILHLDEDAKITPQTVCSIVNYIKKGGNPVANGPTVFPHDSSLLAFYAEAQRSWTYYWVKHQLESSTVYWMNGSNMLVRSDIEHKVGWNFKGCMFSEDTRFAYEVAKKCGKVFGWHGGLTIEKPPKGVKSAIKQRKRWFWGGMLQLKHMPKSHLPRRLYSSAAWSIGFILTTFIPIRLLALTITSLDMPSFFSPLASGWASSPMIVGFTGGLLVLLAGFMPLMLLPILLLGLIMPLLDIPSILPSLANSGVSITSIFQIATYQIVPLDIHSIFPFLIIFGVSIPMIFWIARYQLGLYRNLKYTPCNIAAKFSYHARLLFLAPLVELICTVPTVLALVRPPRSFEITDKEGNT